MSNSIVERLFENKQIEVAKSILESHGYEIKLNESVSKEQYHDILVRVIKSALPETFSVSFEKDYSAGSGAYGASLHIKDELTDFDVLNFPTPRINYKDLTEDQVEDQIAQRLSKPLSKLNALYSRVTAEIQDHPNHSGGYINMDKGNYVFLKR